MKIPVFKLERYFAQYEFKVKYLLSPSDCESLALSELLAMADAETLGMWEGLRMSYTESQGHPVIRHEISRLYETITPEQTLVATPEEVIFLIMQTLLNPGDQVIAISPAYQSLYEIAGALGCGVTPWRLEPDQNGWRLDLDWLEHHLTERTRLLVVNFPHNPTGYLPSLDEFNAIIELARRNGVTLFCDEMYRGLEYGVDPAIPSAADVYERAICLSGLSKSYALPGLRIGWLATQDPSILLDALAFKDYTTICQSAPSEILGIIALRNKQEILQRNRRIIQSNLVSAAQFFDRHADIFEWLPPRAGSVAFPCWRGPGSVEYFCRSVLDELGVMIVPGSLFDYPGEHFRVGLGRLNFSETLGRLEILF